MLMVGTVDQSLHSRWHRMEEVVVYESLLQSMCRKEFAMLISERCKDWLIRYIGDLFWWF